MNFRCFSLVGLVCAWAPYGVSSTFVPSIVSQKGQDQGTLYEKDELGDHKEPQVTLTGGFFKIFTQDAKRSLDYLKKAETTLLNIAKSFGVDIPTRAEVRSDFDSLPNNNTDGPITLTGGFFKEHGRDLCDTISLSIQLDQLATLIQQSLNTSSAES